MQLILTERLFVFPMLFSIASDELTVRSVGMTFRNLSKIRMWTLTMKTRNPPGWIMRRAKKYECFLHTTIQDVT